MARTEAIKQGWIPRPGRVEGISLTVTAAVAVLSLLIGLRSYALGAVVGGVTVIVNFIAIRMVVGLLVGGGQTKGFTVFVLLAKLAALALLVIAVFAFAKINIIGFMIGVLGVVLVIIGESLRGTGNGAF